MTTLKWCLGTLTTSAALLAVCGCDATSSKPEAVKPTGPSAKVAGKLSIKGKAATKGKVTFELTSDFTGTSRREAEVKPDGTFETSAMVGKNSVIVAGTGDRSVEGGYNSTTVEIKQGDGNQVDIDLPIGQAK